MTTATLQGVGIGLKPQHYNEILQTTPSTISWLEVHPENYMGSGGLPHKYLREISQQYPISMHGVGMSLGSADGISADHLNALAQLVERYQPALVSEHLAWSHGQEHFFNDLLPLPYTEESLEVMRRNTQQVQDTLQRQILIENPSVYIPFKQHTMTEGDFLRQLSQQTGCYLLLDVNNVYVSANNAGYCPYRYIDNYPLAQVREIHLAGHAQEEVANEIVCIDDHGSRVIDEVWALFEYTQRQLDQAVPTLIEWDTDTPALEILLDEAQKARSVMGTVAKVSQ